MNGEVAYRAIYIGDDDGEIELCKFIKQGWKVVTDRRKRIQMRNGIVIVFKERIVTVDKVVPIHENLLGNKLFA